MINVRPQQRERSLAIVAVFVLFLGFAYGQEQAAVGKTPAKYVVLRVQPPIDSESSRPCSDRKPGVHRQQRHFGTSLFILMGTLDRNR